MARNNSKSSASDFGDARPKPKPIDPRRNIRAWISPYLDKADVEWLESNRDSLPEFVFGFLHELPAGYTLSSKFDNNTDRWLTTCICDSGDDPNSGLALTARGSTRINSLYTLAYICVRKLEWTWESGSNGGKGDFG